MDFIGVSYSAQVKCIGKSFKYTFGVASESFTLLQGIGLTLLLHIIKLVGTL